ncbi:hypothetical protein J7X19_001422 [Vibrio vulnificus]|nr:hypothetical protein [Vibrio vulnificus]
MAASKAAALPLGDRPADDSIAIVFSKSLLRTQIDGAEGETRTLTPRGART